MTGVAGIVSGIDTGAIVSQLVSAARQPIVQLQEQFADLSAQREAMQQLNTLLSNLQTAIEAADTTGELAAFTATSGAPSELDASVSGDAIPGAYGVEVVSLAQGSIDRSAGFAATTDTINDGTLDIDVGGTLTQVTIDAASGTNTLDGLVEYINENVAGAQAYVLDTGTGANPFQLVVQSSATGAANEVQTAMTTTGTGGTDLVMSQVQASSDAELTVAGTSVFVDSNTPADVIPGVTLNLSGVTTGPVTVTVAGDAETTAETVSSVIDAYNELRSFVDAQSGSPEEGGGGPLAGDSTLRSVARRLQDIVSSTEGVGSLTGLRALGIETDQTGQVGFTSSTFVDALAQSGDDVYAMLVGDDGMFTALLAEIDIVADPDDGLIQPRLEGFDARMDDLADRVEEREELLLEYQEDLEAQFVAMELTLSRYQATADYLDQQLAALNKND